MLRPAGRRAGRSAPASAHPINDDSTQTRWTAPWPMVPERPHLLRLREAGLDDLALHRCLDARSKCRQRRQRVEAAEDDPEGTLQHLCRRRAAEQARQEQQAGLVDAQHERRQQRGTESRGKGRVCGQAGARGAHEQVQFGVLGRHRNHCPNRCLEHGRRGPEGGGGCQAHDNTSMFRT